MSAACACADCAQGGEAVLRDPSAILIAFLLPVVLLIVNGFGISLDAREMKLAVVIMAPEEAARGMLQALDASPYLAVAARPQRAAEAGQALTEGRVRGILIVARRLRPAPQPVRSVARAGAARSSTPPTRTRRACWKATSSGALQVWLAVRHGEAAAPPTGRHRSAIPRLVQPGAAFCRLHRARHHRHGDDDEPARC